MAINVDLSSATLDDLRALQVQVGNEVERKTSADVLTDEVRGQLVQAKRYGYTKQQVANTLTNLVNEVYPT